MLFTLNSCSTVSDTIDLAGIVDKTENFLFGNEETDEQKEGLENNNNVSEQALDDETLDISDKRLAGVIAVSSPGPHSLMLIAM